MNNNKEYFNGGIAASNFLDNNIMKITRKLIIKNGLKEIRDALSNMCKKLTNETEFLEEMSKVKDRIIEINENESKYERKYTKIR